MDQLNKKKLIRLKDTEYSKPKKTFTEKLNSDENSIKDKLDDYVQVEDIFKVPLGTHIRYYKNENGKKKFVLGGKLINNNGLPKYIVLTNGKYTWSVQLDTVVTFFRKMSIAEIKKDYEDMIDELDKKNENLKKIIKEQQDQIIKYQKLIQPLT